MTLIAGLQIVLMLVSLVRAKALAILLSPAGFGVAATIDQLIIALVQLGAIGLPFASLKYMSEAHSDGTDKFWSVFLAFGKAILCLGIVTSVVVSLVMVIWPAIFGAELAAYRAYIQIAALSIPTTILTIFAANALAAAQNSVWAATTNLVVALSLGIGAIAGVVVGGLSGLYIGTAVVGFCGTALGLALLIQNRGWRWITQRREDAKLSAAVRHFPTSAGFYATSVFAALGLTFVRYTVFKDMGERSAGLFQSSISIALTTGAVLVSISNLYLIPLLNRKSHPLEKMTTCNDFTSNMTLVLIAFSLPIACFPKTVLSILYTREFMSAADVLYIFLVWQCVTQFTYVYQHLLIGFNDVLWVPLLAGAGFGSAALFTWLLVPWMGLVGAPIGLCLGMAAYAFGIILRLKIGFGVAISLGTFLRFLWTLIATISGGLLFVQGSEMTFSGISARVLFCIAYLIATWVIFLPNGGRTWSSLVKRFAGEQA